MTQATLFERRLRITTGLILATYIILHLSNHSIGLISLGAMDSARIVLTSFWRSNIGQFLLYGSLITHFLLGLWSLLRRRTLKIPRWELTQLIFGLSLIPLLAGHIAATWGTRFFLEAELSYTSVLTYMFSDNWFWIRQLLLICVAWTHVCIGLHFFFRLFASYRKFAVYFYPLALILPLLAIVSIARTSVDLDLWKFDKAISASSGIKPVQDDYSDSYSDDYSDSYSNDGPTADEKLENRSFFHNGILGTFWGLLCLTLLARFLRNRWIKSKSNYSLKLLNGRSVEILPNHSILEALRVCNISHTSICGGRGRCTTCRVRICDESMGKLAPPIGLEAHALDRINAAPNVRLACQCRPTCDLKISPLVPPSLDVQASLKKANQECDERNIIAMFIDLRDSTKLAERKLPFDILFILNLFMAEMASAIENNNGHYAQFAGDGGMALFGLDGDLSSGALDALRCAKDMQKRLEQINQQLALELTLPLKMGIGIHCGEAIVGVMGPPIAPNLTAIGDNVNVAARLENQAGLLKCELVISSEVAKCSGINFDKFPATQVSLKGKRKKLSIHAIENIADIEGIKSAQ